jgi:two-component sensor histidine kinase
LQDAHQRVMSVATVQQQLQPSGLNESIWIGPYLTRLCASLAASMIGERRPLSIKVQATSGRAVSAEAVSLGLRLRRERCPGGGLNSCWRRAIQLA